MQSMTTHRSLKEKQRQEREALILQTAEEVLAERGYYETSMDEIAARVGVAKGTVYLHFPSKEDLVVAILTRDLQKLLQAIETIIATDLTPYAKMESILQFIYGEFFSKRAQWFSAIHTSRETQQLFLEKKACMRDIWEQLSARMTSLLEEGKAAGQFDPTIPTAVMLEALFSLMSPRSYNRLIVSGQMAPEELARHLGQIYFKGISKI